MLDNNYRNDNLQITNYSTSWNKTNKICQPYQCLNPFDVSKKKAITEKIDLNVNNSTLSLHIAAYENSVETQNKQDKSKKFLTNVKVSLKV
uniref:Uncharacterized protein n=1 Tax=Panagrolaimus superbus TaxID=310955 RepID=A0A914Z3A3_9BILA